MKKILCIGEALIDMICTDKESSLSDAQHFLKKPGGAPANVAAAIAALGGKALMSAKVGNDPFGDHLIQVMKEVGIDTKYVLQDPHYLTTLAFVSLMNNGERDFYFNRGADGMLSETEVNNIDLYEIGILHFGSATGFLPGPLQQSYLTILSKAKENNLLISFDPNYRELLFGKNKDEFIKRSWDFIAEADFIKLSDEEALMITATQNVSDAMDSLCKKTKAVITITIGKEGTLLGIRGKQTRVPSIDIIPIDTTGAGDAFVGAVLFQLSQYDKKEIMDFSEDQWTAIVFKANKAGARTCEYLGAMEAFRKLSGDILSENFSQKNQSGTC